VIACRAKRPATIVDCALCRRRWRSAQSWFQFHREAHLFMALFAVHSSSFAPQDASSSIQWPAPNIQSSSTDVQLLASISAQRAFTFSRFCFAVSLFFAVRSNLSARRHMFTSCLRFVHMPMVFHKKPLAWHSSSAVMISSQPGRVVRRRLRFKRIMLGGHTDIVLGVKVRMHDRWRKRVLAACWSGS